MARETYEMEEVIAVDTPIYPQATKAHRLFWEVVFEYRDTRVPTMSKAVPTDRIATPPKASSWEAEEESPRH